MEGVRGRGRGGREGERMCVYVSVCTSKYYCISFYVQISTNNHLSRNLICISIQSLNNIL